MSAAEAPLTPKQERAIAALIGNTTVEGAARSLKVNEKTLRR
jgi:hypothetical protein